MSLIKELCYPTSALNKELHELEERLSKIIDRASYLVEAYPMVSREIVTDQLMAQLDDAIRRMQAAKRGLGIANRLSGEDKRRHQSRILGNMNRIRAIIRRVEKEIEQSDNEEEGGM